jgi:heme-degrading monooxygenase HmoA
VLSGHAQELSDTPDPPYTAVIFTSVRTDGGEPEYQAASVELERLAAEQPGFLGVDTARDGIGITVSYWRDDAAARSWKRVARHLVAQRLGRERWYSDYRVRVATVTRDYGPGELGSRRPAP